MLQGRTEASSLSQQSPSNLPSPLFFGCSHLILAELQEAVYGCEEDKFIHLPHHTTLTLTLTETRKQNPSVLNCLAPAQPPSQIIGGHTLTFAKCHELAHCRLLSFSRVIIIVIFTFSLQNLASYSISRFSECFICITLFNPHL